MLIMLLCHVGTCVVVDLVCRLSKNVLFVERRFRLLCEYFMQASWMRKWKDVRKWQNNLSHLNNKLPREELLDKLNCCHRNLRFGVCVVLHGKRNGHVLFVIAPVLTNAVFVTCAFVECTKMETRDALCAKRLDQTTKQCIGVDLATSPRWYRDDIARLAMATHAVIACPMASVGVSNLEILCIPKISTSRILRN
jgi:hypothetical protein